MGVIKNQNFGVTSEMVKDLFEVCEADYRREGIMRIRELSSLDVAVVIGFYGCLRGEEVFLMSLKGMLQLWEEMRKNKDFSQIMVT